MQVTSVSHTGVVCSTHSPLAPALITSQTLLSLQLWNQTTIPTLHTNCACAVLWPWVIGNGFATYGIWTNSCCRVQVLSLSVVFLGMAGYYHTFCKNLSDVVAPLTSLASPKLSFVWSEGRQSMRLAVPNFTHLSRLEVDVSALGAEAVLLLEDKHRNDHPIWCFSKKFKKHQLHHSTIEKEALTLLWSVPWIKICVKSTFCLLFWALLIY